MAIRRPFRLAVVALVAARSVSAQGLPFHTENALTMAFEQRGVRMFGSYQSRGEAHVWVAPLVILPFSPHQRLATKVVMPLASKRFAPSGSSQYSSAGLGDVELGIKWAFWASDRRDGTTRLAVLGSATIPTGATTDTLDGGAVAPPSLQLGRGAASGTVALAGTLIRGAWGLSADLAHTRAAGHDGFVAGAVTAYDLAVGYRIPRRPRTVDTQTLQVYLEWNGTVSARSTQAGSPLASTGGHVAYVSPGVQWVVLPQLLVEASVQFPAVQDHNGTQPDFGLRSAWGARFLFF